MIQVTAETAETALDTPLHPLAVVKLRDYSARLSSGELPANGDTARRLMCLHRRAESATGYSLDLNGHVIYQAVAQFDAGKA